MAGTMSNDTGLAKDLKPSFSQSTQVTLEMIFMQEAEAPVASASSMRVHRSSGAVKECTGLAVKHFLRVEVGTEPRASCLPGKRSTTELHSQHWK